MRSKNLRKIKYSLTRNERGVALLMAIFTFVLVAAISMELLEETQVEYLSSSQNINQVKAYYAAKSGAELALLRILIYKKARALAGDSLGQQGHVLDKVWSFPFIWPPILPPEATLVDKQLLNDTIKESYIDVGISSRISSESSKIDVNALGSKSKILAKHTRELLLKLFQNRMDNNEEFGRRFRGYNFETLVNHLTDWVDEDNESKNGGDERSYYRDLDGDTIPPNQPFKTLPELHMVEEMTDELYDVLEPNITIYGVAGINVNQASKQVLMLIDKGIDEKIADEIIKHIKDEKDGGPFAKLEDFFEFLQKQGLTLDLEKQKKEGAPLIFDEPLNFRVVSTATVGQTSREIVAITYDFDRVKKRLAELIAKDNEGSGQNGENSQLEQKCKDKKDEEKFNCLCEEKTEQNEKQQCIDEARKKAEATKEQEKKKNEPPKGKPTVVYWSEK